MLAVVIASIASSAPGGVGAPSGDSGAQAPHGRVAGADKCRAARKALRWYVGWTGHWREQMGQRRGAGLSEIRSARNHAVACPQYLAKLWRSKAIATRQWYKRWHASLLRRLANPTQAILYVFGAYGQEALRVASCESGRGIYARNGQYLGIFQMGDYARSRFGHSWTALGQARAAYRYFVLSGRDWSPWSCKP